MSIDSEAARARIRASLRDIETALALWARFDQPSMLAHEMPVLTHDGSEPQADGCPRCVDDPPGIDLQVKENGPNLSGQGA